MKLCTHPFHSSSVTQRDPSSFLAVPLAEADGSDSGVLWRLDGLPPLSDPPLRSRGKLGEVQHGLHAGVHGHGGSGCGCFVRLKLELPAEEK